MTEAINRRKAVLGAAAGIGVCLLPFPADAEQLLRGIVAGISRRFECVTGNPSARCETGASYVALMAGGIKTEGFDPPPRSRFHSAESAVSAYAKAFDEYAAGKSGKLYWRSMPRVERHYWDDFNPVTREYKRTTFDYWVVRSRLVID